MLKLLLYASCVKAVFVCTNCVNAVKPDCVREGRKRRERGIVRYCTGIVRYMESESNLHVTVFSQTVSARPSCEGYLEAG